MKKKSDAGHEYADKCLEEMERKIRQEYGEAIAEVEDKLNDYLRRFHTKDKVWQRWVKQDKRTEKEYKEWRIGQIAVGDRWQALRDSLTHTYLMADRMAYDIINDTVPDIFAENLNYATYEVESGLNIDTSFLLYDTETITRILNENPQMLPPPGRKASRDIREGKVQRWNNKQIQSVMTQSILQGVAIPEMASKLAQTVGDSDYKAAIRNARTMTTGAENAGRVAGYKRAESMGIELGQQWIATLDGRTRHSHRMVDGEVIEVGGMFSNNCRFPGDPQGPAGEVYNCRCTLIASIKGFEFDARDLSQRATYHMEGMSYEEWKHAKARSEPIDKQARESKAYKDFYTNIYKGLFDGD